MPSGWQTLRGIRGLCNRSRYPQSGIRSRSLEKRPRSTRVANKRGTTWTGQIRQWIEEGLEAAAEGMNTSRGRRCRIRLVACEARPSLRNLHDEILSSGIGPGSRYARFRLLFLLQHEDGAATASGSSAGGAAHVLP
jgi:hypothetical protein